MHNHMRESSRLWDYQVLEQLGRGEYGQVFRVKNKKDSQIYALKKVNISSAHQKEKIQAFRQIKALKLIKHPDIIEYYESFLSMDNIYIVMEYAAKGDFSKIVKERRMKQKPFSEQQLWNIFAAIANGVKYLHEKGIIHRDLKLQNIFLTQQGKVKIGDLGMSKVIQDPTQLISQRVGTPVYFAPEIIQHQLYSYPVDIWALGCMFYYLATLEHPFKEATIQTLPYFVIDKDPKPIKGHYGGYMINFINSLLVKSPKSRPDIFEVNITIKNRDNPNPNNKVRVYDFKKLLMMKPDLNKLEQMKKSYRRPSSLNTNFDEVCPSSPTTDRYKSSTDIKTYRDFIKMNHSQQKINNKLDPEELQSPSPRRKLKKMANLSVVIPSKKFEEKVEQPFSPIKTNGFGDSKQISRNSDFFSKIQQGSQRPKRNYGAFRQIAKKPSLH